MKKVNSRIITHKRIGQAYLDDATMDYNEKKVYSSATAVRKMIRDSYLKFGKLSKDIIKCIPKYVYDELLSALNISFPVFSDDFDDVIFNAIRLVLVHSLEGIYGMKQKLASAREFSLNNC